MRVQSIAAAAVVIAWLLTPDVLCLLPGVDLSAVEEDCCRRMAGDCGSMPMPKAHACCKTIERPENATLSKSPDMCPQATPSSNFAVEIDLVARASFTTAAITVSNHAPPGAIYNSITVLRI
ncbi:MAG: hypothetical protein HY646_05605 [Acidobacteria bacterium]|nr:hypothetical protein [Acidobacteriota bacterium]